MAHKDRILDAKLEQCLANNVGLRGRRPDRVTGTFAIAKTWPVEDDHAMFFGHQFEHATYLEIIRHCLIAVEQHDRRAGALLQVMEPHTIDLDERASGGVVALGSSGQDAIEQCGNAEPNNH